MTGRELAHPTNDEWGAEEHPAFAMISANRVTSSHGASLFDSEIRHQHYVVLKISGATRKRDLQRDWIHDKTTPYIEVAMSETQWASMISSMNTSGTPCTLTWIGSKLPGPGHIPSIPFAPRLALSIEETRDAARRMFRKVKEALAKVEEKPTKANVRALRIAVDGAEPNVRFASESLAEHAENTVAKAKADIEAMVDHRARQVGIDPHLVTLESADEDTDGRELL